MLLTVRGTMLISKHTALLYKGDKLQTKDLRL
jgi:hypothetical protein